jgi:hypothetical protein
MATRMQQRRGTAAQWVSTNSGNGPILNAGEIGYETDTNKFKIGDGTNHWINLDYFIDANSTVNPSFGSSITFEGATANDYETTLAVTDPTADRTITLPNASGTVVLADGSGNVTVSGDLTVSGTTTTINSTTINATTGIVFEGLTANAHETTLTVEDPTADRTITFPDATGTVALIESVNTSLSGYVETSDIGGASGVAGLNSSLNLIVPGSSIIIEGATDNNFETTLVVTDPTADRTITLPDATGTLATTADISAHDTDTTNVHGIADTSALATTADITAHSSDTTGIHGIADTSVLVTTSILSSNLSSKADLASPTFSGTVTLPTGTVTSAMIADGTIVNADINASAAIDKTKISGTAVTVADTGTVTSTMLADATIVDGDISATAAIAQSKISGLSDSFTAKADVAGPTFTGTVTIPTLAVTTTATGITKTMVGLGNVDNTADASKPVSTAQQTALDLKANLSGATFTGAIAGTSLTLSGDLTVNGTTTTLNSTSLSIDDKNIELGSVASPSDTTADGGGITLKGATDKTFNWVDATDSWTSSEHINLASGKDLKVNGTAVISSTAGGFIFTDGTQTKEGVASRTPIIQKTDSYTLSALTERDSLIEVNKSSASTLTIPLNATIAYPVGTSIDILQTGTGQVSITIASGGTLNCTPSGGSNTAKLRAQWSSATLFKRAENTWVVMGDLSA